MTQKTRQALEIVAMANVSCTPGFFASRWCLDKQFKSDHFKVYQAGAYLARLAKMGLVQFEPGGGLSYKLTDKGRKALNPTP